MDRTRNRGVTTRKVRTRKRRRGGPGRFARSPTSKTRTDVRRRSQHDVFVSYASQDEDEAQRLVEALKALGLDVWYAPHRMHASDHLPTEILRGVHRSRLAVVILSHSYLAKAKTWPLREFRAAAKRGIPIVPVWHQITLAEIKAHKMRIGGKKLEDILHAGETSHGSNALATRIDQILNPRMAEPERGRHPAQLRAPRLLVDRLNSDHWKELWQAAVSAATAGGMAAMYSYRRSENKVVQRSNAVVSPNPSTEADYEATAAIIRAIDKSLGQFVRQHGAALLVLGEETENPEQLAPFLYGGVRDCIKAPGDFFKENDNSLRVILDGIDGTGSFMRGIPLFCTAVAILIGNQVRVSAVYDPIHHVVYSGALEGRYDYPEERVWAEAWSVATGNRLQLPRSEQRNGKPQALRDEAVGVHFTRSNHERLKEILRPQSQRKHSSSTVERIARSSGGVYALNSGVLAMAEVASGGLGAFINNVTNLWDVAAGEVLVRACGGRVTEFSGAQIDYSVPKKISVVAAKQSLHSAVLSIIHNQG